MMKLIIGNEGTGKTMKLLDLANNAVTQARGILYILTRTEGICLR